MEESKKKTIYRGELPKKWGGGGGGGEGVLGGKSTIHTKLQ